MEFPARDSVDSASDPVIGDDLHPFGTGALHKIVQYPVDEVLLVYADAAETEQVVLERAEFNDRLCRSVVDPESGEIGQSGKWADRGEFICINGDNDVPSRVLIGEGLERGNVD